MFGIYFFWKREYNVREIEKGGFVMRPRHKKHLAERMEACAENLVVIKTIAAGAAAAGKQGDHFAQKTSPPS